MGYGVNSMGINGFAMKGVLQTSRAEPGCQPIVSTSAEHRLEPQ